MVRAISWWWRLGAMFAAFLMAVIVLGPSLDSLVCRDDTSLAAASVEASIAAAAEHGLAGEADETLGACLHGHCHHGGMSALLNAAATPFDARRAVHALPRERIALSDRKFDLMRPPRA